MNRVAIVCRICHNESSVHCHESFKIAKCNVRLKELDVVDFDVLLTVHRSTFISVFNQLDAQNLFLISFYFVPLHVSSTCAHHQEVKIALHSLWYYHNYRWPGRPPVCVMIPEAV